jgi:rhamnose transport system permease protein
MKTHAREISVCLALCVMLLALAFFAPSFYQPQPLLSFLAREAPALIVTCGVALVMIARQIDISIGSQFAVCSVGAGLLAGLGWPIEFVLVASIGMGTLLGAVNGVFVAVLRLPSIVVTLATMATWREALRWKRQGAFVNLPNGLQWFGMHQTPGQIVIVSAALLVLIALSLTARHLAAGRMVYAVGSDAEAARLAGIRPQLVTFLVFGGMGALTGFAALLNIVQSPQVDPKSGTGLELGAIASAVVGGVAISGGRGNLLGVFAGFLLLACVSPALIHLHIEAYWERAIAGAIILAAVLGDGLTNNQKTQLLAPDRLRRA